MTMFKRHVDAVCVSGHSSSSSSSTLQRTPCHHGVDARACLDGQIQRCRVMPVRRLQDEPANNQHNACSAELSSVAPVRLCVSLLIWARYWTQSHMLLHDEYRLRQDTRYSAACAMAARACTVCPGSTLKSAHRVCVRVCVVSLNLSCPSSTPMRFLLAESGLARMSSTADTMSCEEHVNRPCHRQESASRISSRAYENDAGGQTSAPCQIASMSGCWGQGFTAGGHTWREKKAGSNLGTLGVAPRYDRSGPSCTCKLDITDFRAHFLLKAVAGESHHTHRSHTYHHRTSAQCGCRPCTCRWP